MSHSNITSSSIVSRAKEVSFTHLDDEHLAIDSQAGYVYSLNETRRLVWDLIAEPVAVSKVCDKLVHEFAVDSAQCQDDVLALLTELQDAELVVVA